MNTYTEQQHWALMLSSQSMTGWIPFLSTTPLTCNNSVMLLNCIFICISGYTSEIHHQHFLVFGAETVYLTLLNELPPSLLQSILNLLPGSDKAPLYRFDVSYSWSGVDMMVHTHKQTYILWCNDFLAPVVSCQQTCWNLRSNPRCGKYPCKSESETLGNGGTGGLHYLPVVHKHTHRCTHGVV